MTQWYFAYGSNMLREQMMARTGLPNACDPPPRKAWLDNYQLRFTMRAEDGEFYANIATPGRGVTGVLYACTDATLEVLDEYERGYARHGVTVSDADERCYTATTYIALPQFVAPEGKPSKAYLEKILTGAHEHGLSPQYMASIEAAASI